MRLLNADKITADSELIVAMVDLFKSCKMQHKDNCLAEDCYECASRFFKETFSHIQPVVSTGVLHDISGIGK